MLASARAGSATLPTELAARCTPLPSAKVTAPTPKSAHWGRAALARASTTAAVPRTAYGVSRSTQSATLVSPALPSGRNTVPACMPMMTLRANQPSHGRRPATRARSAVLVVVVVAIATSR